MSLFTLNEAECLAAGLDPEAVRKVARRLATAARDARRMGLMVFGGAGSGSLRLLNSELSGTGVGSGKLVVAYIDGGTWDGGDGGAYPGADGLERGES